MKNHLVCITAVYEDYEVVKQAINAEAAVDVEISYYQHSAYDHFQQKLWQLSRDPQNKIGVLTGGALNFSGADLDGLRVAREAVKINPEIHSLILSGCTEFKKQRIDPHVNELPALNIAFIQKLPNPESSLDKRIPEAVHRQVIDWVEGFFDPLPKQPSAAPNLPKDRGIKEPDKRRFEFGS